ncbi:MAG TPA: sigma factor-like helix-turn-helix DNA-binding protein [Ignavibacteriaceae bacterium]|nr:sigma factor-like helix-turn-helix DNA-binding protein [Ignavibacteriaceae bacterium]
MIKDYDTFIGLIKNSYFFLGKSSKLLYSSILSKIPLENLEFSIRFSNTLKIKEIKTVLELLNTDFNDFLEMRNCGIKSINDAQNSILNYLRKICSVEGTNGNKKPFIGLDYVSSNEFNVINEISKIPKDGPSLDEFLGNLLIGDYCKVKLNVPLKENNSNFITGNKLNTEFEADTNNETHKLPKGINSIILSNYPNKYFPVYDLLDLFWDILDKRTQTIFIFRFANENNKSLKEIGEKYNLSRERIRQIITQKIRKLKEILEPNINEYNKHFLNILIAKPRPIEFNSLENKPSLKRKLPPQTYIGILSEIFEEVPFEGLLPKSFDQLIKRNSIGGSKWKQIIEELENMKLFPGEISTQKLVSILSSKNYTEADQLLCFKIVLGSNKFYFYKEGSNYFLLKRGSIRESIFSILSGSEKPLNINSIMKSFHKYYGRDSKYDSLISVIGNIKQDERIIQFDRYIFGIEKHFTYSKEVWSSICLLAKNLLAEMKRQCYVTEILEAVKMKFPLLKSKYELVNILRTDDEIIDLGFFTFSIPDTGIKNRIKLKDLILKIFKANPRVRHYTEINNEILEIRHVRSEGLNMILKNINEIVKYPCSFYGLKEYNENNINGLSKNQQFLTNFISSVLYPDTRISKLLEFFITDENKNNCLFSIRKSRELKVIDSLTSTEPFILSMNWSLIKLVKCILFHNHKPMYLTEIKWILSDLGVTEQMLDEYKYKILEDKQIINKNQTLEYLDCDIGNYRNSELIDTFYELLLDTRTTFAFRDLVSEFSDDLEQEGLDENKLRAILEDDERFIITDELIMVRSS